MMTDSILLHIHTWANACDTVPIRLSDHRTLIWLPMETTECRDKVDQKVTTSDESTIPGQATHTANKEDCFEDCDDIRMNQPNNVSRDSQNVDCTVEGELSEYFLTEFLDKFGQMTIVDLAGEISILVAIKDGLPRSFPGGLGRFFTKILEKIFDKNSGYFDPVYSQSQPNIISHYIPTVSVKPDIHFRAIGRLIGIILREGNVGRALRKYILVPQSVDTQLRSRWTLNPTLFGNDDLHSRQSERMTAQSRVASVDDTLFFHSHEYIRRGFYDIFYDGIMSSTYPNGHYIVQMLEYIARYGYSFVVEAGGLVSH
jgi:hypothetical protein